MDFMLREKLCIDSTVGALEEELNTADDDE